MIKKDKNSITVYNQDIQKDDRFTTRGYDEFYAGAIFTKKGKIIKAFLDSHVAFISDNAGEIYDLVKSIKYENIL